MDDLFPCKIQVSNDDLLHKPTSLLLTQSFLDKFAQIRVTKLSDDVCVIFGGKHFIEVEDMRKPFELFENDYLALEQCLIDFIFEHLEIDDFDCHIFLCLIIFSSVDLTGVAFAYGVI